MARVVFFVSSMDGGGAERVAALLCNAWVAAGHSVTLAATYSGRGGCSYVLDRGVEFVYLADLLGTTRRSPVTLLRRLWLMRDIVSSRRPDLVVSFLTPVNVATLIATRGLDVAVAVSERTYPPAHDPGWFWALLRRLTYPWATRVVMQTQRGRDWLRRELPSARGAVIANPCVYPLPDTTPRQRPETHVPADRRMLLAAGRLTPEKGFDRLVSAYSGLVRRYPEWDLAILGDGQQRAELEALCAAKGVAQRVHFPGRTGNMGAWYRRAEIYVLSSRYEGFPNTLMEAMAHGLPVVSTDCPTGPRDLITHGIDGLLVDPESGAHGLKMAIADLMADPDRQARLAAAARNARERFAPHRVAEKWLDELLGS